MENKLTNFAEKHSPQDLLLIADQLLSENDPNKYRAVVLEAITALECFVYQKVFGILNNNLDPLLVNWLEEKTRSDFDSRLSVFTPVATKINIDKKKNILWVKYLKARNIRNKVAHTGKIISYEEAKEVRDTVFEWLSFLGCTSEIDMELIKLRKYYESSGTHIKNERDCESFVRDYFSKINTQKEYRLPNGKVADLLIEYGKLTVLIEVKFHTGDEISFRKHIDSAVTQLESLLKNSGITRGVIIAFQKGEIYKGYEDLLITENGIISYITLKIDN